MGLPIGKVQPAPQTTTSTPTTEPRKKENDEPPVIRTVDGKFYSGMTAHTARRLDLYESFWGTDFRDIDTDENKVLSPEEICDRRDVECSNGWLEGGVSALGGLVTTAFGFVAAIPTFGLASGACFASGAAQIGNAGYEFGKAGSEQEKTDAYREQYLK